MQTFLCKIVSFKKINLCIKFRKNKETKQYIQSINIKRQCVFYVDKQHNISKNKHTFPQKNTHKKQEC